MWRTSVLPLSVMLLGCGQNPAGVAEPMWLSGRVLSSATNAGIPDATVEVRFVFDARPTLAETTTSSTGGFELSVRAPPGYAAPNCYVMDLSVTAPGYTPSVSRLFFLVSEHECRGGGRSNVQIVLNPLPVSMTGDPVALEALLDPDRYLVTEPGDSQPFRWMLDGRATSDGSRQSRSVGSVRGPGRRACLLDGAGPRTPGRRVGSRS